MTAERDQTRRAVLYLRQSKDTERNGLAVDRQREACERLAKERGWTIVGTYVDNDVSASDGAPRPDYERMVADAERGIFEVIVAYHVDRLTRRLVDLEALITLCQRTAVRIATVSGDLDLGTDAGRLVGRILASVARGEIERKSRRQIDAARQRAEQGKPAPARRAFGYTADGMQLHPDEAPLLAGIYARAMKHLAETNSINLSDLARWLTSRGSTTPQGLPWRRTGVRSVLLNPRNAALRAYSTADGTGRRTSEIVAPAVWPPAVDPDVWHVVTGSLQSAERATQRNSLARWLLTDLGRCGRCDDGTTVLSTYRETGRRIYRCKATAHLSRTADQIDDVVNRAVIARLSRPDAVDLMVDNDREDVTELRLTAAALRRRQDDAAQAYAAGTLELAQLTTITASTRDRLREIETRILDAARAPVLADLVRAADVPQVWADLPLARRRLVVDTLMVVTLLPVPVGRRAFDPETVTIEWRAT